MFSSRSFDSMLLILDFFMYVFAKPACDVDLCVLWNHYGLMLSSQSFSSMMFKFLNPCIRLPNNFVSAELLEGLVSTIVRKRWVF